MAKVSSKFSKESGNEAPPLLNINVSLHLFTVYNIGHLLTARKKMTKNLQQPHHLQQNVARHISRIELILESKTKTSYISTL